MDIIPLILNGIICFKAVDERGTRLDRPQGRMIDGDLIQGRRFWGETAVGRDRLSTGRAGLKPRRAFVHLGWRRAPRALRIC